VLHKSVDNFQEATMTEKKGAVPISPDDDGNPLAQLDGIPSGNEPQTDADEKALQRQEGEGGKPATK
jgi:hypothetical protein